MKTVEVLGGPEDGSVYQVPDSAPALNFTIVPELTVFFDQDDEPELDVTTETVTLPIVGLITRDGVIKQVAAWPFYDWPTRRRGVE